MRNIHRLLALNIDDTLVKSNGKISKATKEAIDYVQQKGIYVTLVTSRSFPSAKKVAKALKIDSTLITHQGAYIGSELEKPIYVRRINEDITFEAVRFLESFSCNIRLVHERQSISNKTRLANNNLLAKTIFSSGDPVYYSQQYVDKLSETLETEPLSPLKIEVFFEHEHDMVDAKKALEAMFLDEVSFVSTSNRKLDIVKAGVSKLRGLLYLGEQLNISRQEMVVIGNGLDDIDMIDAAGLGVASNNAPYEVKRVADWITRSSDQQGVAYMVKEHFRKQQPIEFLRKMNILKK